MHPADAHVVAEGPEVTHAVCWVSYRYRHVLEAHASPEEANENFGVKIHAAAEPRVFADIERCRHRIDPEAAHRVLNRKREAVHRAPEVRELSPPEAGLRHARIVFRIAADERRRVLLHEPKQCGEDRQINLPVCIHLQDVRVAQTRRRLESRHDGRALALINRVMNHFHEGSCQPVAEALVRLMRPVVDENHRKGKLPELCHHALELRGLIVNRYERADAHLRRLGLRGRADARARGLNRSGLLRRNGRPLSGLGLIFFGFRHWRRLF